MQYFFAFMLWLFSFSFFTSPPNSGHNLNPAGQGVQVIQGGFSQPSVERTGRKTPRIVVNTEDVIYAPPL